MTDETLKPFIERLKPRAIDVSVPECGELTDKTALLLSSVGTRDVEARGHQFTGDGIRCLAKSASTLDISWNEAADAVDEVEAANLKSLVWRGEGGRKAFSGSVGLLDLSESGLEDIQFVARLRGLVKLVLHRNALSDGSAEILAGLQLEYLGVSGNFFTDEGARILASGLPKWGLDLSCNELRDAEIFADDARRWLGLRGNMIRSAKRLVNSRWGTVDLRENMLTADEARAWRGSEGPKVYLDDDILDPARPAHGEGGISWAPSAASEPNEKEAFKFAPRRRQTAPAQAAPMAAEAGETREEEEEGGPTLGAEPRATTEVRENDGPSAAEWEDTKNLLSWLDDQLQKAKPAAPSQQAARMDTMD